MRSGHDHPHSSHKFGATFMGWMKAVRKKPGSAGTLGTSFCHDLPQAAGQKVEALLDHQHPTLASITRSLPKTARSSPFFTLTSSLG